jgi:isopenicillin-N N-acyltransferase like protein
MSHRGSLNKIIISGDAYSRGVQYGKKARRLIEKGIGIYRATFFASSNVTWKEATDFSKRFLKTIKEYDEEMIYEIRGIAEGSGRSVEEIMILNLRTEIYQGLKQRGEGCTSLCALPEVTRAGKTLLAQNWDYRPWASETLLFLQIHQEKRPDILTLVEAGQLARFGMNSAGHGICNNFIQCDTDGKEMEKGVPTTFIRRKALGQEKYGDVISTIIHSPRSFSANYLIATSDGDGDAINIEATPEAAYFLFPEKGLVTHSNHFKGAGAGYVGILQDGFEDSLYRDRRAERLLRENTRKIGIKEVMNLFKDHFGYPRSICRHPDPQMAEGDRWQTNASVIMDLTSRVLWVAPGPPCEHGYRRLTFDGPESVAIHEI